MRKRAKAAVFFCVFLSLFVLYFAGVLHLLFPTLQ